MYTGKEAWMRKRQNQSQGWKWSFSFTFCSSIALFSFKKCWRKTPLQTQVLHKLTRREMLHSPALNLPESTSSPNHLCPATISLHSQGDPVLQDQRIVITQKRQEKEQLNMAVGSSLWELHGSTVWAKKKKTAPGDPEWMHGSHWGLIHLLLPRFMSTNVALFMDVRFSTFHPSS